MGSWGKDGSTSTPPPPFPGLATPAPARTVAPQHMSEEITKVHILVVEDETEHADVMCEALTRLGHKCDVTYALEEAKAKLGRRKYDVVVTDLLMEGRPDGMEVLRLARGLNPPPPVILVTALNDVPTSKKAMQEGAYDYIVKPLDLEHFREQVNRAAEKAADRKSVV